MSEIFSIELIKQCDLFYISIILLLAKVCIFTARLAPHGSAAGADFSVLLILLVTTGMTLLGRLCILVERGPVPVLMRSYCKHLTVFFLIVELTTTLWMDCGVVDLTVAVISTLIAVSLSVSDFPSFIIAILNNSCCEFLHTHSSLSYTACLH